MPSYLRDLWIWAHLHWGPFLSGVVWPLVSGLLVVLLVPGDKDARIALAQRNPALKGLLDALRGLGLDPAKVLEGMHLAAFGKPADGGFSRFASFVVLCVLGSGFAWLVRHGTNAAWWPVVSGVLALLLRKRTPEEWEAMTTSSPRLKGLVLVLRGMGLDPAQVRDGLVRALRSSSRSSLVPPSASPAPAEPSAASPAAPVSSEQPASPDVSGSLARASASDELSTPPERPMAGKSRSGGSDPPPSVAVVLVGLAGALAGLLAGSVVLSACKMPAPDGCEPRTYRCDEHRPWVCSPGQRWTPLSEPCAVAGAVCCEVVGPSGRIVATCAPADRCLPRGAGASAGVDAGTED